MTVGSSGAARVLRNTASNSIGRIVNLTTAFLMVPFVLGHLGEAAFGTWVLANVVVAYGSLLDLGMGSAVVKHVAQARAKGVPGAGHELLATATRIYTGLGLVALVLGTGAAWVIAQFAGQEVPSAVATAVVALVAVSFAVTLGTTPASAVSLASVMGPPCCHEHGTTWRCQ